MTIEELTTYVNVKPCVIELRNGPDVIAVGPRKPGVACIVKVPKGGPMTTFALVWPEIKFRITQTLITNIEPGGGFSMPADPIDLQMVQA